MRCYTEHWETHSATTSFIRTMNGLLLRKENIKRVDEIFIQWKRMTTTEAREEGAKFYSEINLFSFCLLLKYKRQHPTESDRYWIEINQDFKFNEQICASSLPARKTDVWNLKIEGDGKALRRNLRLTNKIVPTNSIKA